MKSTSRQITVNLANPAFNFYKSIYAKFLTDEDDPHLIKYILLKHIKNEINT